jgi:hypothetical protein
MAPLKSLLFALAVLLVGACSTDAQPRADESREIQRKAAAEVTRICALPEPDRDAEISKARDESGVVVRCPTRALR